MITQDLLTGIFIGISFCWLVNKIADLVIKIVMVKNKE